LLKPDSILIFGEILSVKKEHCSKLVKFWREVHETGPILDIMGKVCLFPYVRPFCICF